MAGKGFTVKKNWDNPTEHAMAAGARVPTEMRLGNVLVAPATVLAPMAGVTDTVFRRFIRHASLFTSVQVASKEEPEGGGGTGVPSDRSSSLGWNFNPRKLTSESMQIGRASCRERV